MLTRLISNVLMCKNVTHNWDLEHAIFATTNKRFNPILNTLQINIRVFIVQVHPQAPFSPKKPKIKMSGNK